MFSSKPFLRESMNFPNPSRVSDHSDFDLGSAWNELAVYPLCAVCWQWNRFRRRVGLRSLAQSVRVWMRSLLGEAEKFWGWHERGMNNVPITYLLSLFCYTTFDGWNLHLSFRSGDSSCGFFKLWGCGPGHRSLRKWRDLHDIDFEKFIGASLATEKGHWEGPRYWIRLREERMIEPLKVTPKMVLERGRGCLLFTNFFSFHVRTVSWKKKDSGIFFWRKFVKVLK